MQQDQSVHCEVPAIHISDKANHQHTPASASQQRSTSPVPQQGTSPPPLLRLKVHIQLQQSQQPQAPSQYSQSQQSQQPHQQSQPQPQSQSQPEPQPQHNQQPSLSQIIQLLQVIHQLSSGTLQPQQPQTLTPSQFQLNSQLYPTSQLYHQYQPVHCLCQQSHPVHQPHRYHPYNHPTTRSHTVVVPAAHVPPAEPAPVPLSPPSSHTGDDEAEGRSTAPKRGRVDYTREFKDRFGKILQISDETQGAWNTYRTARTACTVAQRPCMKVYREFCEEHGGDLQVLSEEDKYMKLGTMTKCACSPA